MPFRKYVNHAQPHKHPVVQVCLTLALLSFLISCTTTFIPGLDRILFSNSSAKVGPLVTAEEQYPVVEEESDSSASKDGSGTAAQDDQSDIEPTQVATAKPSIDNKAVASQSSEPKVAAEKAEPGKISKPRTNADVPTKNNAEQVEPDIAVNYGTVTGQVVLLGDDGSPIPGTGTMVTLTPKTMVGNERKRPSQTHIIDMKDKTYLPRYSTIQTGDQVVFVNKDNIRHNVFSSSGSNAFDLGTYGAGLKRAVKLEEPGIVKIYCNIHPEMATFVAVGEQGLSVKTDDQGRYTVSDVLPGKYELSIWNLRGESKRIVDVRAGDNGKLVDRISTSTAKVEPHKNKFGADYSKNSTLFEDEFY